MEITRWMVSAIKRVIPHFPTKLNFSRSSHVCFSACSLALSFKSIMPFNGLLSTKNKSLHAFPIWMPFAAAERCLQLIIRQTKTAMWKLLRHTLQIMSEVLPQSFIKIGFSRKIYGVQLTFWLTLETSISYIKYTIKQW